MSEWECSVCGYIYDPKKGDKIHGILPNTDFEDIPADWICPACGANIEAFIEVK